MASKFTIHNGLESDSVNSPINATLGFQVGGLSVQALSGKAIYVDADTPAGAGADGVSKATAFATIQAGVNDAVEGDVILVYPGTYAESVTVATDYVTIVGAIAGRYGWPDVAPTTGTALTVTAQGFAAARCRFVSDDSDSVIQRGNGFIYYRCVFDSGTGLAATEGLLRLQGLSTSNKKTASEGLVEDCHFRGASGVGVIFQAGEPPTNGVGSSDCTLRGCRFVSSLDGTAGVDLVTQDSVAAGSTYSVKNLLVENCTFEDKNKATYIDFTTANAGAASDQKGTIQGCRFADDAFVAGTDLKIVGTGFTVVGCFLTTGALDGSGLD